MMKTLNRHRRAPQSEPQHPAKRWLLGLAFTAVMLGATGCASDGRGTATEATASTAAPVRSVPQVDLNRYLGRWYEIAAYPMFFQRQCLGDTTAEYALRPDGGISVRNRCRTERGFDQADGRAWVVEGSGNAQLKVSFFWPMRADYWVIGLDPEYRWAVVGAPGRRYLWLLSRSANPDPAQVQAARRAAAAQGYDLSKLRETLHR